MVRRTRRLVKLAVQMAGNSSGTIPQQTGMVAHMKAAYRLFATAEVTHEAICRPHFQQTRERAEQLPLVFLVQDTMELNYTGHRHCEGLSPVGWVRAWRGWQSFQFILLGASLNEERQKNAGKSKACAHGSDRGAALPY